MKLQRIFVLLALFGIVFPRTSVAQQSDWESAAVTVRMSDENFPEFIRFSESAAYTLAEFPALLREVLQLGPNDEYRLVKTEHDAFGFRHTHYQQYHRGIPVQYAIYRAHEYAGKVVSMNGYYFPIFQTGSASFSAGDALQLARDHEGGEIYKYEMPTEEAYLKLVTGNPFASYHPGGDLVYVRNGGQQSAEAVRMAYRYDLYAHQPNSRAEVYVDAQTGEVIFRNELIHTGDANGTAVTKYSGTQAIVADSTSTTYRLRETGRANGVETFNMLTQTDYSSAVDFTDADNFWDNINANQDEVATDAHWGAEMTFDYFFLEHGRNSYDGNGAKLISYVHYGSNYVNAFWNGVFMTYGDGNQAYSPFPALDVVGHEFAHGLTGNSAGLVYQNEPGALNESFSDIFGTAIEFYGRPNNGNWLIGEDVISSALRSMSNPNLRGDPDTYFGTNWFTGSGDNGGVHVNSGVQNFWFYLLTEGGSGVNDNNDPFSVNAMGIDTAAMIAFRNLTVYLGAFDEYEEARFYAIESTKDLFGFCSPEMINVMNAWAAVGVGLPYTGTLNADFSLTDTASCSIPFDVNFTNSSTSAVSYQWDFGDGSTSTFPNPSHQYTQYGTYTVSLIIQDCNGNYDTLTMPNRVVIDNNLVCQINMPGNGADITVTGCSGELYDSGGADNYLDNIRSEVTIQPGGGNQVQLTFSVFDYNAGDRILIFDGPDDQSPSLGIFAGNTIPGPFTSTSGSLTIVEWNNAFGNREGFQATWNCVTVDVEDALPTAELSVYPNPIDDQFRVIYDAGYSGQVSLSIIDMFGKVIEKRVFDNVNQLNERFAVEDLAAGVYLLRLQDNEGLRVKQLRVQ